MVCISSRAHGGPVFCRLEDGDGDGDDGAAAPGTASVRRRAGRRSEVPNAWVSRCRMESCHVARFGIAQAVAIPMVCTVSTGVSRMIPSTQQRGK
jgi:hypothetical protein